MMPLTLKVAIVGSGNWASAIARRVGLNVAATDPTHGGTDEEKVGAGSHGSSHGHGHGAVRAAPLFDAHVKMYVYEEEVAGRKLSEIINTDHENPKYLPGVRLPLGVVAEPDLVAACASADVLLFVVPHQYLKGLLKQLKGHVKADVLACSLCKGLDVGPEGPVLLSTMIKEELGLAKDVAVVMGANGANEVAEDQFVEATVACADADVARVVADLLDAPCFRTSLCADYATVEVCGALKNVIALGAGFCDALGLGYSTKAAVLRRGLVEMMDFCRIVSGPAFEPDTAFESCGVADIICSSFNGRNRKCAAEYARRLLELHADGVKPSQADLAAQWQEIERTELGGQKMQGVLTVKELFDCLKVQGLDHAHDSQPHRLTSSYAWYMREDATRRQLLAQQLKKPTPPTPGKDEGKGSGAAAGNGDGRRDMPWQGERPTMPALRFGLFARIHAISVLGDSPMTLFDW
jgi:glycerol-3-phosphate dehydrogenase (NAD+)